MAELTIKTDDIAAVLRKHLEGFTPSLAKQQVGRITEVGDGIARISGLPECAVNELIVLRATGGAGRPSALFVFKAASGGEAPPAPSAAGSRRGRDHAARYVSRERL